MMDVIGSNGVGTPDITVNVGNDYKVLYRESRTLSRIVCIFVYPAAAEVRPPGSDRLFVAPRVDR